MGQVAARSLQDGQGRFVGAANYVRYFATPAIAASITNSLAVASSTTVLTVGLAFAYAYALTRTTMPWRGAFRLVVVRRAVEDADAQHAERRIDEGALQLVVRAAALGERGVGKLPRLAVERDRVAIGGQGLGRVRRLEERRDRLAPIVAAREMVREQREPRRITAVALALEELHSYERIEKVGNAARMQTELFAQFSASDSALPEPGEKIERNSGKENFGVPETEARLQNCVWRGQERIHGAPFNIERFRFANPLLPARAPIDTDSRRRRLQR